MPMNMTSGHISNEFMQRHALNGIPHTTHASPFSFRVAFAMMPQSITCPDGVRDTESQLNHLQKGPRFGELQAQGLRKTSLPPIHLPAAGPGAAHPP